MSYIGNTVRAFVSGKPVRRTASGSYDSRQFRGIARTRPQKRAASSRRRS